MIAVSMVANSSALVPISTLCRPLPRASLSQSPLPVPLRSPGTPHREGTSLISKFQSPQGEHAQTDPRAGTGQPLVPRGAAQFEAPRPGAELAQRAPLFALVSSNLTQISTQQNVELPILYIYIYVCMYVCMYVCIYTYVCMCVYIYIDTHIVYIILIITTILLLLLIITNMIILLLLIITMIIIIMIIITITLTLTITTIIITHACKHTSTTQLITQITLHYTTLHYTTLHYKTVQYSTVQYSTVQYSTVQYSTPHRAAP